MSHNEPSFAAVLAILLTGLLGACGPGDSSDRGGGGAGTGAASTGGSSGSGNVPGSGGGPSGGASTTGGATATGGVAATGGSAGTGGGFPPMSQDPQVAALIVAQEAACRDACGVAVACSRTFSDVD